MSCAELAMRRELLLLTPILASPLALLLPLSYPYPYPTPTPTPT